MAGIYIHIPFCKKACHYCNFHFSTSLHRKPALIQALLKEIQTTRFPKGVQTERLIQTIYFGGGTPSILTAHDLTQIFAALHKNFTIDSGVEITLEANPDDITLQKTGRLARRRYKPPQHGGTKFPGRRFALDEPGT